MMKVMMENIRWLEHKEYLGKGNYFCSDLKGLLNLVRFLSVYFCSRGGLAELLQLMHSPSIQSVQDSQSRFPLGDKSSYFSHHCCLPGYALAETWIRAVLASRLPGQAPHFDLIIFDLSIFTLFERQRAADKQIFNPLVDSTNAYNIQDDQSKAQNLVREWVAGTNVAKLSPAPSQGKH